MIQFTNGQEVNIQPLDPLLTNFVYPFPVKFITVAVQQGNYKMAYMDVPPIKPNGRTVLLFHGKNCSGSYWEELQEYFKRKVTELLFPTS